MLTGVAQFDKLSSEDSVRQCKLSFTVDATQKEWLKKLWDFDKGATFLITLIDIDEAVVNADTPINDETIAETLKRLQKRMHATIKEIAKEKNVTVEDVKMRLRKKLITAGFMKKSTSELNEKGYSTAIYYLLHNF